MATQTPTRQIGADDSPLVISADLPQRSRRVRTGVGIPADCECSSCNAAYFRRPGRQLAEVREAYREYAGLI